MAPLHISMNFNERRSLNNSNGLRTSATVANWRERLFREAFKPPCQTPPPEIYCNRNFPGFAGSA